MDSDQSTLEQKLCLFVSVSLSLSVSASCPLVSVLSLSHSCIFRNLVTIYALMGVPIPNRLFESKEFQALVSSVSAFGVYFTFWVKETLQFEEEFVEEPFTWQQSRIQDEFNRQNKSNNPWQQFVSYVRFVHFCHSNKTPEASNQQMAKTMQAAITFGTRCPCDLSGIHVRCQYLVLFLRTKYNFGTQKENQEWGKYSQPDNNYRRFFSHIYIKLTCQVSNLYILVPHWTNPNDVNSVFPSDAMQNAGS